MSPREPLTVLELEAVRQRWGRVGVWWSRELASRPIADICATAAEVESFGFPTLWFGESVREAFSVASALLGATIRLGVATGVANVSVRDPVTSIAGARTLGEAHPGRFTLGLGISHARVVGARGHTYDRPLATMRAYLRDLSSADYLPPQPDPAVPVVIAALGPKMLELAAQHADGAHPYLVPIEHTASARAILGPNPLLAVEQAVVLESEPTRARAIGRQYIKHYLQLPNYVNNLRAQGFGDRDFSDGGSDRLIDAVVAWGDVDAIALRVHQQRQAGADHVCIQPIAADGGLGLSVLRELAPALLH